MNGSLRLTIKLYYVIIDEGDSMYNLLIIGAGGYGYVAKNVAESMSKYEKISFIDDNNPEAVGKFDDYIKFTNEYNCAFVALGNPKMRRDWFEKLKVAGYSLEVLISDKSYVSPTAKISEGSIVEPMAVVNSAAEIGCGVLVCAGAVVNHNSTVKDFCQIDCGAVVGAGAVVEENTKLEYNQVIYRK